MKFFLIVVNAPIIGSTNTTIRCSGSPKLRRKYSVLWVYHVAIQRGTPEPISNWQLTIVVETKNLLKVNGSSSTVTENFLKEIELLQIRKNRPVKIWMALIVAPIPISNDYTFCFLSPKLLSLQFFSLST